MTRLSVNVDHVATLRQARGHVDYPSPVEAAQLAEGAGAAGITVHLRSDRRHIQDSDVEALRDTVRGKLNLEMAAVEPMLDFALRIRPDQVTLVPERPGEITTEGGLDLAVCQEDVGQAAQRLAGAGTAVSLFLDPDPEQLERAAELSGSVSGFELNTDRYTRARDGADELARLRDCSARGADLGLEVYAGHGLTTGNVGPVAALTQVEELNIGHAIVCRAVLVGMHAAVAEMAAAIEHGSSAGHSGGA